MAITRLRKLILDQELPQYALASAIGFHPSTLSEYALGHRVIKNDHLILICRYFHLSREEVVGYVDEEDIIIWANDLTVAEMEAINNHKRELMRKELEEDAQDAI